MAWLSWAKSAVLLRLVLLTVWLWCAQLGAVTDSSSSQFEEYPKKKVDIYEQEENRKAARERQELYRKRVVIPEAAGDDVQVNDATNRTGMTAQTKSLPTAPEERSQNLLLACAFLLTGVLVARKLAPEIADYFNKRYNPWVLSPALTANSLAKVRAEDEAFSEFLLAFRTGPSATPGTSQSGVASSKQRDPLNEFFASVPDLLGPLRMLLQEISRASNDAARQKMLTDLHRKIRAMKDKAGLPELLPVWQMASALEGLLKQLTDKMRNVTPSTLRTVIGGVDLLEDLCKPGLKADLLASPPLRFLAVDDDLISRNVVALALKKALNQPDLAENGETALALAAKQAYDVIFLDVQMPGMDGFEVCTRIHETVPNRTTPVVFVTCQSDFETRAQSTLSGGSDLIGKPFLTFEITVKALTLAMRGRLQGRAQTDSACKSVNDSKALSPDVSKSSLAQNPLEEPTDDHRQSESPAATIPNADHFTSSHELSSKELVQAFLTRASTQLVALRDLIQAIFQTADVNTRQEMLVDFYLRLHSLAPKFDSAEAHPAIRMCAALDGLLKKLLENPKNCTSSTLLTVATAVDLLNDLCVKGVKADMATNPPIRILVVDDDPVVRRAITCALQMAFEKPESVEGGEAALASTAERPFDVIFLDVQMPGMDGFTVCSKIRETVRNRATPVVFVTGHNDFKTRTQSTLSGGGDLIGKPFLTAEVTVKAFTFALRGRLQKHRGGTGVKLT